MIVYVFIIKYCGPNVKAMDKKVFFGYWVLHVSVKIRISECSDFNVICHITGLEEFFRDNLLLKDEHSKS